MINTTNVNKSFLTLYINTFKLAKFYFKKNQSASIFQPKLRKLIAMKGNRTI